MSQENYVEVQFCTLTKKNGTSKPKLWRDAAEFFKVLAQHTKCHLHVVRGYEAESANSHEHAIISVYHDEVDRFMKRSATFKSNRAWSMQHEVVPFDNSKREDAYRYVLVKHQPVMPDVSPEYFCPRKYHQCKKGQCKHIPA